MRPSEGARELWAAVVHLLSESDSPWTPDGPRLIDEAVAPLLKIEGALSDAEYELVSRWTPGDGGAR